MMDQARSRAAALERHGERGDGQRTLAALFSVTDDLGTSMYFDMLAGRRLEVEALTGAVVAAGERHGIATPLNRALLALLRAISDGAVAGALLAYPEIALRSVSTAN